MLTTTITMMIEAPHQWEQVEVVLHALGALHGRLGIQPRHYFLANATLTNFLVKTLGNEIMDVQTRASWIQVLALIARTTLSGAGISAF